MADPQPGRCARQSVVQGGATPEGALLSLRARSPGSDRAYTGVTLVAACGGGTELVPPGVRVTGARHVLLLTRVHRHTGEADVLAEARRLQALAEGTERPSTSSSPAIWTGAAPPTGA